MSVFLTIWSVKLAVIGRFGSDLPYWDQWAKEGELLFEPWFEHHEIWHNLFVPHNEHRIAPTLAMDFALLRLGGDQWDARVQCIASAALHALLMTGLLWWAMRRFAWRWTVALAALLAIVAAPPIAWENVLDGFQSQFYFLAGFSLLGIAGILGSPALSVAWFGGVLSAGLASVSMGSGFLLAAPVAGIAALRIARARRQRACDTPRTSLGDVATLVAAVLIGAIGAYFRPLAPWHSAIRVHSVSEFIIYSARCLAWPLYRSPWLAMILWSPWAVFAIRRLAGSLPPPSRPGRNFDPAARVPRASDDLIVAGGLWVLVQVVAVTYSRAGGSVLPAARYGDIFALGLVCNFFALMRVRALPGGGSDTGPSGEPFSSPTGESWSEPPHLRRALDELNAWLLPAAATAWFAVAAISVLVAARNVASNDLPARHAASVAYERNVQAFVLTNDYGALASRKDQLPFPFPAWLARMLRNATLRRLLPESVREPIRVAHLATAANPAPSLANRVTRTLTGGEWRSPVLAPSEGWWKIETSGDVGKAGAQLVLESARTGRVLGRIVPSKPAGRSWRAAYVRAPSIPARIVARVAPPARWIAFSEPVEVSSLGFLAWMLTKYAVWIAAVAVLGFLAIAAPELPRRLRNAAHSGRQNADKPDKARHPSRVFGLDFLRASAIACVVLTHGGLQVILGRVLTAIPPTRAYSGWSALVGQGGAIGVELFFVLSGFLIGGILFRTGADLARGGGLFQFYVRRWFRTLPVFGLALVGNVLFERYFHGRVLGTGEIVGQGLFLRNFSKISLTFFPESWSLAVEEWFYLLFPAMLFLTLRLLRVRHSPVFLACAAGMFLFSTVARTWGAFQPGADWVTTQRCVVIYRFDALMTGVVAAWIALRWPQAWRRHAVTCAAIGLLMFAAVYATFWVFTRGGPADGLDSFYARTYRFNLISLGFALLLPAASTWIPRRERVPHALVRRIALWSYSLYLVHWPVFQLLSAPRFDFWQQTASRACVFYAGKVLLATAIAAAIYHWYEAPFMRLRDRLPLRRAAAEPERVRLPV